MTVLWLLLRNHHHRQLLDVQSYSDWITSYIPHGNEFWAEVVMFTVYQRLAWSRCCRVVNWMTTAYHLATGRPRNSKIEGIALPPHSPILVYIYFFWQYGHKFYLYFLHEAASFHITIVLTNQFSQSHKCSTKKFICTVTLSSVACCLNYKCFVACIVSLEIKSAN